MLGQLREHNFPSPLPLLKLIGPSFIILGVGLGSGELILWPYLSSNFSLGIIWGALVGITLQFFLNMEIERYTLARGESVFVGLTRKLGVLSPTWFILSTFIPWIWPGIITSSAVLISSAMGLSVSPILLLILLGLLYSLGSVVYKTQETVQKTIILIGVPLVFVLTAMFAGPTDIKALAEGLVGKGEGYWFLPLGIPIGTFLTAFVYAGAGGNLNLAQSLYAREKGYGMAAFAGKIQNVFIGRSSGVELEGYTFPLTKENLDKFKIWWRRINTEHFIVFWLTGAFTMLLLSLLAYSTVFGNPNVSTGINFVIEEAKVIGASTNMYLSKAFLIIAALMLFGTQFSVYGSNARIMSENLILLFLDKIKSSKLSLLFYIFLFLQVIAGIVIFTFAIKEPLTLLVIGGALNAVSMFVYSFLILWLNLTSLEKPLRPSIFRIIPVFSAGVFYGVFSFMTVTQLI